MKDSLKLWWVGLTLGLVLAGTAAASPGESPAEAPRLRVVTTIFPLYDWVRAIGGNCVEVKQLLPPGVEAHMYAPKPSDVMTVRQADLFVYLHPAMEPWAADVLAGAIHPGLRIVELAQDVELHTGKPEASHETHDHASDVHYGDPHIWLDPVRSADLVRSLAAVLAELDPVHRDVFEQQAQMYCSRLHELDRTIRAGLSSCRRKTVIFAGHNAFHYFAERYGLTFVSPYPGFSPDAAPGPRALTALARTVRETGSTVIFHEELVAPRVAETIARETGARLETLHAIHNLSHDEQQRGETYLSLMEANLRKLKEALDCP